MEEATTYTSIAKKEWHFLYLGNKSKLKKRGSFLVVYIMKRGNNKRMVLSAMKITLQTLTRSMTLI